MMQLLFFAVAALVLLFGHFLAWLSIVKFFSVSSVGSKVVIALIIVFLFISAIAASYLIHKWDNLATRWYYMLAAFWIGVLANFGLMVLLVLIIKLLAAGLGFNLEPQAVKGILILGTLFISGLGLFYAFTPKVTEYVVKIKDLPLAWQGKSVVQISDVHLGPVYRKKFFSRVMDRVNELKPEVVFITGDLFDGMEADFSWMNTPFAKLKAAKGVYYSFGNHDLYLGFDRVKDLLKKNPIEILDDRLVTVDDLQIIGINYSFNQDFDLYEAILEKSGYNEAKPSILLYHEPKNIELASKAGIDLQLSGHTHRGQLFPFSLLAKLAYKGRGYGLFVKDNFSLIVSSGLGTWGPPMRTTGQSEIVKITLQAL
jgi:predicted MPP superfamily phosphohydrolase